MSHETKRLLKTFDDILQNKKIFFAEALGGVNQLVYNPVTRSGGDIGYGYSGGNKKQGMTWANHDDHLHISFTNKEVAMKIIDTADQMGLVTSENPYAKKDPNGKVDQVHVKNSEHYQLFPGKPEVGLAVDIRGDKNTIVKLIKWIESTYGDKNYPIQTPTDSMETSSGSANQQSSTSDSSPEALDAALSPLKQLDTAHYIKEDYNITGGVDYSDYEFRFREGSKILSPEKGEVVKIGEIFSCPDSVLIKHLINDKIYYSHICGITNLKVETNDMVSKGETIGSAKKDCSIFLYDRSKSKIRFKSLKNMDQDKKDKKVTDKNIAKGLDKSKKTSDPILDLILSPLKLLDLSSIDKKDFKKNISENTKNRKVEKKLIHENKIMDEIERMKKLMK